MCLLFIFWIFATPVWIAQETILDDAKFRKLFIFDVIFMLDRLIDIFVSFYKPNGEMEHRLFYVVFHNIGIKFFLEIAISMVPWFIHYSMGHSMKAHLFAVAKIARYGRLFELDTHINNYIESTADRKTVFELA